ncbi:putative F-box associated interaction domain-containing protein [Helianthus annuus]|nr:putative F-box associated interaction domain-containing protein [Helianthus annuus]
MFQKSQYFNHMKQCELSFLRLVQGTTTVRKNPVLDFCFTGSCHKTLVLGSCNGLTLACYKKRFDDIFLKLIDPIRKECYNLPPIKISPHMSMLSRHEAAGIGFDDSTNTLKTVFVILKEPLLSLQYIKPQLCTMIHYSKSSSWREITQIPAYPISGEGVFAHGRLHWLASRHKFWSYKDGRKIVWFDVKLEKFGLTDTPKLKGGGRDVNYDQLVDLNGEVGIAYRFNDIHIKLWILKAEGWVLRCWFDLDLLPDYVLVSGCLNKDGDILLASSRGDRLFVYTQKSCNLPQVDWDDGRLANIRMYRSSFFSTHTSAGSIKNKI